MKSSLGSVAGIGSSVRRAVIDVGTNSVKLLIADVAGRDVTPVSEESDQTRLGEGFFETQRLQPAAVERTTRAVAAFADKAKAAGVCRLRIIATSAARDARNPQDLTGAIEKAAGLTVEIIPGDREAEWAFKGVTSDPELDGKPLLLLDIGGGSTEFILGIGQEKHFQQSFQMGTVRLLEKFPPGDPPAPDELQRCRAWVNDYLRREVCPRLDPLLQAERSRNPARPLGLVGTGGTMTILARMEARLDDFDREKIEAVVLSRERIKWHTEKLWGMALSDRKQVIGLPPKRADVILFGVAIYEGIMNALDFPKLKASTRGLRFAAVMDDD